MENIFPHVQDMFFYGKGSLINQYTCPQLRPLMERFGFEGENFILSDGDKRWGTEHTLNRCTGNSIVPFQPMSFRKGLPTPGLGNDCSGISEVLSNPTGSQEQGNNGSPPGEDNNGSDESDQYMNTADEGEDQGDQDPNENSMETEDVPSTSNNIPDDADCFLKTPAHSGHTGGL